ncbi:MAG: type II toxin-antitoxin system PemK/MazF family toxin [Gammaproteobacteria bacterium]|nr:type II toxin-antitoxin system PemK/MazF family toxin [Gammaproteobacteria bacterium]
MLRGEIWIANHNPNKGAEIGKQRPVIIMQEDRLLSTGLHTIITIPLTTQYRPAFAPMRIHISARGRLLQDCYAMVEHPRALDRSRFGEGPITRLTPQEIAAVERGLLAVMGIS